MRALLLLLLISSATAPAAPIHTHGMDLNEAARTALEQKAARGDAAAAWRLYHYYALERHDEAASTPWLKRAAALDHAQAQRSLAHLIKDYNYSPDGFGSSGPAAVRRLLERSARSEGDACYEIASAYAEGYFGAADHAEARSYFERGARFGNRMCWEELSRYQRDGLGGPRDYSEAYYWISLEARCVDPRSVGGKKTWAAREKIAALLTPDALAQQWTRIDGFMAQLAAKKVRVDSAPFLSGMINPKLEAGGRRFAQRREDEHRKKWRAKTPN